MVNANYDADAMTACKTTFKAALTTADSDMYPSGTTDMDPDLMMQYNRAAQEAATKHRQDNQPCSQACRTAANVIMQKVHGETMNAADVAAAETRAGAGAVGAGMQTCMQAATDPASRMACTSGGAAAAALATSLGRNATKTELATMIKTSGEAIRSTHCARP